MILKLSQAWGAIYHSGNAELIKKARFWMEEWREGTVTDEELFDILVKLNTALVE